MTESIIDDLKGRELRRFHQAVNRSVESMLAEKYEATRELETYRRFERTCGFVKNFLQIVDILADNAAPLFDKDDERSNWEVYLSGSRRLIRQMPDSYLFRFVLPMFGLDEFRDKVTSFSGKWLEQIHAAHNVMRSADVYLANANRGSGIAREYGAENAEIVRLYASLKTWQTQIELERFQREVEEFLSSSVEVFITGPIQLYLMLSPDTILLLFKTLSVGRLSELRGGQSEYGEVMKLADFARGTVEDSDVLDVGKEILSRAVKEYSGSLRKEQDKLRAQLPGLSMRHSFIQRFEHGTLFKKED